MSDELDQQINEINQQLAGSQSADAALEQLRQTLIATLNQQLAGADGWIPLAPAATFSEIECAMAVAYPILISMNTVQNRTVMLGRVYYLFPLSESSIENGSPAYPYKSWASLVSEHGGETQVLVYVKDAENEDIIIDGMEGWSVCSLVASRDAGRSHVRKLCICGDSSSCHVVGLVVDGTFTNESVEGRNYIRFCTIKGLTTVSSQGYSCFELSSFEQSLSLQSGDLDLLRSQFSNNSILAVTGGECTITSCRNVSLQQTGGFCVSTGASNFSTSPNIGDGTFGIISSGGVFLAQDGSVLTQDGFPANINISGGTYSLGKLSYKSSGSTIGGVESQGGLQASQVLYSQNFQMINPDGSRQSDINKSIDSVLQQLSEDDGVYRGVVLNAFTRSETWMVSGNPQIITPGSGYAVGDVLYPIIQETDPEKIPAWFIVTAIGDGGTVSAVQASSKGAFTEDMSGIFNISTSGAGTMCQLSVAFALGQGSIIADIPNLRPGDTFTVKKDETHGGAPYDWGYGDRNGDGISNPFPLNSAGNSGTSQGIYYGDGIYVQVDNDIITLKTQIKGKIDGAVQRVGDETISGVKTFTSHPIVPSKSTEAVNSGASIATEAQVFLKVSKEQGKGLSSNDFTIEDKTKLAGLVSRKRVLSAPTTVYLNASTGSDSNDGLSTSTALRTIAGLRSWWNNTDQRGFFLTIDFANGDYLDGGFHVNNLWSGSANILPTGPFTLSVTGGGTVRLSDVVISLSACRIIISGTSALECDGFYTYFSRVAIRNHGGSSSSLKYNSACVISSSEVNFENFQSPVNLICGTNLSLEYGSRLGGLLHVNAESYAIRLSYSCRINANSYSSITCSVLEIFYSSYFFNEGTLVTTNSTYQCINAVYSSVFISAPSSIIYTRNRITSQYNSTVFIAGALYISGTNSRDIIFYAEASSRIHFSSANVYVENAITVSNSVAYAQLMSIISGSVTWNNNNISGRKYFIQTNSLIQSSVAWNIPGDIAGTTSSGGGTYT